MISSNTINILRLKSRLAISSLILSALSLPGTESVAVSSVTNKFQVIIKGLLILFPLIILPVSKYLTNEQIQKNQYKELTLFNDKFIKIELPSLFKIVRGKMLGDK